jgi:hypothetical protein
MKLALIFIAFVSSMAQAQAPSESSMPVEAAIVSSDAESVSNGRSSFSEALFFADKGRNHFSFTPEFSTFKYAGRNVNGSSFSRESRLQKNFIAFEHGFGNSDVAFRIETFFVGSQQVTRTRNGQTADFNFRGNGDIFLSMKAKDASVDGNFISEIVLGLNTEKQKFAYTDSSGNLSSGGSSLTPRLSYEVPTGFGSAGAQLGYTIYGKTEAEGRGDSESTIGGNTASLKGFAELEGSRTWLLGTTLTYSAIEGSTIEGLDEDGSYKYDSQSYNNALVELYGKVAITEVMSIKPKVSYLSMLTSKRDGNTYDKSDETSVALTFGSTF